MKPVVTMATLLMLASQSFATVILDFNHYEIDKDNCLITIDEVPVIDGFCIGDTASLPIFVSSPDNQQLTSLNVAVGIEPEYGGGVLNLSGYSDVGTIWPSPLTGNAPALPGTETVISLVDSATEMNGIHLFLEFDLAQTEREALYNVGLNHMGFSSAADGSFIRTGDLEFIPGTVYIVPEPSPWLIIFTALALIILFLPARNK